ncbi:MAG: hypothetical protein ACTSU3_00860 [Candidatus Thorarchaeota archaeon]
MGMISKLIGLAISAAGVSLVIFFGTDYIFFIIGIIVTSIGASLIMGGKKQPVHKPPPPTVTEIHCDNTECDFKEIRDFEIGDYILKSVKATCPKCTGTMTIEGVYVIKDLEEEEKYNF